MCSRLRNFNNGSRRRLISTSGFLTGGLRRGLIMLLQLIKFQQNRIMRGWVIDDSTNFHSPLQGGGASNKPTVFRGECVELQQIWTGRRTIIRVLEILLDFRYIAAFLNARPNFKLFIPCFLVKIGEGWEKYFCQYFNFSLRSKLAD